jgi:hypothetical protein
MTYDFDTATLSCFYKEAFGFRPLSSYFAAWEAMSDDEKQSEWDNLADECARGDQRESDSETEALLSFSVRMDEVQSLSPGLSDDDAIRWLLQAEGFSQHDYMYGATYCAYHLNLSHDNDFKDNFERVCAAASKKEAA